MIHSLLNDSTPNVTVITQTHNLLLIPEGNGITILYIHYYSVKELKTYVPISKIFLTIKFAVMVFYMY